MRRLRPFIKYYGSKWRLAPLYPAPEGKIIIEPFAGSAQYATLYPDREVHLYDLDDKICGVWDYLIHGSKSEILSLPLLLDPEESLLDHDIPQEAKWLIGYWLGVGATPILQRTPWGFVALKSGWLSTWCGAKRNQIANSISKIRHWKIHNEHYQQVKNVDATWFIDPPYQIKGGEHYRRSNKEIDYENLKSWTLSRKGLKIVCEAEGAKWMDFQPLKSTYGADRSKTYKELIWTNYEKPQLELWR